MDVGHVSLDLIASTESSLDLGVIIGATLLVVIIAVVLIRRRSRI